MKNRIKIVRCILLTASLATIVFCSWIKLKRYYDILKFGTEYEIEVEPDKKKPFDGNYFYFEMPRSVEGQFDQNNSGYLAFLKGDDGLAVYAPVTPQINGTEPMLKVRSCLSLDGWGQEIEPPFKRWYLGRGVSPEKAKQLLKLFEEGKLTIKFCVLRQTGIITGVFFEGKPLAEYLKR